MSKKIVNNIRCIDGEIKIAGLDSRMIGLLHAIDRSGSINQAAKLMGLSYKGAWQMIERANLCVPKPLVVTATGGSRGGGTCLSEAGKSLVALFKQLEQRHNEFIMQLNDDLSANPDVLLLMQRQAIKTSACNQLFGSIDRIIVGAVNAEVVVQLKGGALVMASLSLNSLAELGIKYGMQAVLLINSVDILLSVDIAPSNFSARNHLPGKIIQIQQDDIIAHVIVILSSGELLTATITQQSVQALSLRLGLSIWLIFKLNAPVLGVLPAELQSKV